MKDFPRYLAYPDPKSDSWFVSKFDGRGAWANTGAPVSVEEAKRLVRQGNRELRLRNLKIKAKALKKQSKSTVLKSTFNPGDPAPGNTMDQAGLINAIEAMG